MRYHTVRANRPGERRCRETELAWKIAEVAAADVPVDGEVADMVINRVIDDFAVGLAAAGRQPVAVARAQALRHPRADGATVLGLGRDLRVQCEWAAWANGTAVRELDFNDAVIVGTGCHPGDNIPALIAVAQQCGCSGADLIRAIATAYEVQINLATDLPIGEFAIDQVGHLGPSIAAGIGSLLRLPVDTIYQAVQHAAHVSMSTRQGRKGMLSSWKAFAPGHVGKLAIEASDRAMRGETSPSPLYEGEYIGRHLGGLEARYKVALPDSDAPRTAILESYPKEHSAGYHAQAVIDLAFRLGQQIEDFEEIDSVVIHTKKRSHEVMGSGSNDPEKWDPNATRETLDHSMMFIFAVAIQDRAWHHEESYRPERVRRPDTVRLWKKVSTVLDEEWERRFMRDGRLEKDHGARVVITFRDGRQIIDELAVANSHPRGATPWGRSAYAAKFRNITDGLITEAESERFLNLAAQIPQLTPAELRNLNVELSEAAIGSLPGAAEAIF